MIRRPMRVKEQVLWMTAFRHICKVQRCSVSCSEGSCLQDTPGGYWLKDDLGPLGTLLNDAVTLNASSAPLLQDVFSASSLNKSGHLKNI